MTIDEYVLVVRRHRVARGRMEYFRDISKALSDALKHDLAGAKIKAQGRAFDERYPEESADGAALDVWPSGEDIATAIAELKNARAALEDAWQALSEDEQAAVIDPRDQF